MLEVWLSKILEINVFCTIWVLLRAIVHWQQHKILRILAARTINYGNESSEIYQDSF
jgi:hypothetical protein